MHWCCHRNASLHARGVVALLSSVGERILRQCNHEDEMHDGEWKRSKSVPHYDLTKCKNYRRGEVRGGRWVLTMVDVDVVVCCVCNLLFV